MDETFIYATSLVSRGRIWHSALIDGLSLKDDVFKEQMKNDLWLFSMFVTSQGILGDVLCPHISSGLVPAL